MYWIYAVFNSQDKMWGKLHHFYNNRIHQSKIAFMYRFRNNFFHMKTHLTMSSPVHVKTFKV